MTAHHSHFRDKEFLDEFSKKTLDPSLFSHEAHIRLAWIVISKEGIDAALTTIPQLIKNYVLHLGAQDKYHHTLTVAAIKTVHHFVLKDKARTFEEFIKIHPRLNTDFKKLIDSHYQTQTLQSDKARKEFVPPDLLAYDI